MPKKNSFQWTEEAKISFQNLKQAVTEPPVLAVPIFQNQIIIECDTSGRGIGAVLIQEGKPITFLSQAFEGKTLNYSTYEEYWPWSSPFKNGDHTY